MLEIQGKYNIAKVFTDNIEPSTVKQIISMCNKEEFKNSKICFMPDVHPGKGCLIGTAMTINNTPISPALIGADIGCGVIVFNLTVNRINLPNFDSVVNKSEATSHSLSTEAEKILNSLICKKHIRKDFIYSSFGNLGGGNHFLELNKDNDNKIYLIIHSGSRSLGGQVADYYINLCGGYDGFLSESEGQNYLHDMALVQQFAKLNREEIGKNILKASKIKADESFDTVHNFIDFNHKIVHKGSISANLDEKIVIPLNMRDGAIIGYGKGNSDWNFSAPHGAGRKYRRSEVKDNFSFSEYKKSMDGIFSSSVVKSNIDECPMAYKDSTEIINLVSETITIDRIIKPIYNYKGH